MTERWERIEQYSHDIEHGEFYTFPPLDKEQRIKFINWVIEQQNKKIQSLKDSVEYNEKELSFWLAYAEKLNSAPNDIPSFRLDDFMRS